MTERFAGLISQYLVLAHFLFNRETRWDVGIPGVCIAFSALGGRLQSSHCQATTHQQENNTSRDQCECTYTLHTGRQHMLLWYHIFGLKLTLNKLRDTAHPYTSVQSTCMRCYVLLWSWYSVYSNFGSLVMQSLFERQGMTLHGGGLHPGMERGHIPLPKGMSRTKSFGKTLTHPAHS